MNYILLKENSIPKFIPVRNDICIKNNYGICNNLHHEDFYIVIFFINSNKCKIIIRRIDEETGWINNLQLKLHNLSNDNYEIISCGSSIKNEKIFIIYTNILIEPVILNNQKIPKRIVQTSRNNTYNSLLHYNAVKTFIELNPEYEYYFFDDIDCRLFIKENFDISVLDAYDILAPGAFKADLFRYCYVYIMGGCYFDNKYILRVPLRNVIKAEYDNIYCKDTADDLMFNSIILSVKNCIELKNSIERIVQNVKNKHYGKISLEPTGPKLFNIFTKDKNVILYHKSVGKHYTGAKVLFKNNNEIFCNTHYKGYYYNPNFRTVTYEDLFQKREIYYLNMVKINDYVILVFPHHTSDIFNFWINDNKIIIKRIDRDCGWGQDLKIRVIDNNTNIYNDINIGNSDSNIREIEYNK